MNRKMTDGFCISRCGERALALQPALDAAPEFT